MLRDVEVREGKRGSRKVAHGLMLHFPWFLVWRHEMREVRYDGADCFRDFLLGEGMAGLKCLPDLRSGIEMNLAPLRHGYLCKRDDEVSNTRAAVLLFSRNILQHDIGGMALVEETDELADTDLVLVPGGPLNTPGKDGVGIPEEREPEPRSIGINGQCDAVGRLMLVHRKNGYLGFSLAMWASSARVCVGQFETLEIRGRLITLIPVCATSTVYVQQDNELQGIEVGTPMWVLCCGYRKGDTSTDTHLPVFWGHSR